MKAYPIPYEQYSALRVETAAEHNYERGLLQVKGSGSFGGQPYRISSASYTSLSHSRKVGYPLIPQSEYAGETFDVPAHFDIGWNGGDTITLPSGAVRKRGDDTGQRVMHRGACYVQGPRVFFQPLLPVTVGCVTLDQAQAHHKDSSQAGWRSLLKASPPQWVRTDGVLVAICQTDHGEIVVGHALIEGKVIDFFLEELKDVEYLRSLEGAAECGFNLRKASSNECQMALAL